MRIEVVTPKGEVLAEGISNNKEDFIDVYNPKKPDSIHRIHYDLFEFLGLTIRAKLK
mgnify:FL=1